MLLSYNYMCLLFCLFVEPLNCLKDLDKQWAYYQLNPSINYSETSKIACKQLPRLFWNTDPSVAGLGARKFFWLDCSVFCFSRGILPIVNIGTLSPIFAIDFSYLIASSYFRRGKSRRFRQLCNKHIVILLFLH